MNLAFHFDFRKSYICNEAVQLELQLKVSSDLPQCTRNSWVLPPYAVWNLSQIDGFNLTAQHKQFSKVKK